MNISLSAFAPENLVSRDGFGSPARVSLLIFIVRLDLVLTYGIPPELYSVTVGFSPTLYC